MYIMIQSSFSEDAFRREFSSSLRSGAVGKKESVKFVPVSAQGGKFGYHLSHCQQKGYKHIKN